MSLSQIGDYHHLKRLKCEPESRGWSGGAKVLDKLPVPGRPTILIAVGQGSTVLAVGAGGGCLDIFTLISSPWRKKSITPKFPKITFLNNLILNNDIHIM